MNSYTPQSISQFKYRTLGTGKYEVEGFSGKATPILGLPNGVKAVSDNAFSGNTVITELWLPNGLTSIRDSAFRDCTKLRRVSIPATLESVGSMGFYNCKALERVDITDLAAFCKIRYSDATSNPLQFARKLYLNGEPVVAIRIPDGITKVNQCAFYNCSTLTRVVVPEGVTEIDNWGFWSCENITEIYLPSTLKRIGNRAFWQCKSLKTIYFGGSSYQFSLINFTVDNPVLKKAELVTNSNEDSVCLYENGESISPDGSPVEVLSKDGFSEDDFETPISDFFYTGTKKSGYTITGLGNKRLERITLPRGTYSIADEAFKDCKALTSVVFPEGLVSIGGSAFQDCSNLMEVYLPTTVRKIGSWCFTDCNRLMRVNIKDLSSFLSIEFGDATGNPTANGARIYMNGRELTKLNFPKSIKQVGECGIYNCHGIQSVYLHEGVTKINNWGFWTCHDLESIFIPSSMKEIGKRAFWQCDKLKDIYYSGSRSQWSRIKVLEDNPQLSKAKLHFDSSGDRFLSSFMGEESDFDDEEVLSKDGYSEGDFYLGEEDLEEAGLSLFDYTTRADGSIVINKLINKTVKDLVIPAGVAELKASAFEGCNNLVTAYIPEGVKTIPSGLFKWCKSLKKVHIPASVTEINATAFQFCPAFVEFDLDGASAHFRVINGVLYTKDGSILVRYPEGKNQSSFAVPGGVTRIGRDAFCFMNKLNHVVLSDSVREISDFAFSGCYDLKSITLPRGLNYIGTWAFKFCSSLKAINYKGGFLSWLKIKKKEYAKPFLTRVNFNQN